MWSGYQEANDCKLLYSTIYNCLIIAKELNCKSISIPAVSSGIYGFPKELCASIIFDAVEDFICNLEIKS